MEELQMLVNMVASLPTMAIWVLVGFFAYKTIIIGSIYGVIRTGMTLLHSWATKPKKIEYTLHSEPIDATVAAGLQEQIRRINANKYVHQSDVAKLAMAIDIVELTFHNGELLKDIKQFIVDKRHAGFSTSKV